MKRKIIIILPIIIAIAIFIILVKNKQKPVQVKNEMIKSVLAIKIKPQDLNISLRSFGVVKPKYDLNLISAVNGDILYVHPRLKNGNFIKKDEVLLKIDEKEYFLKVKDLEIKIKELNRELDSSKKLLKIEQEKLLLDKKELKKYENIKNQISDSKLTQYKNIVLRTRNLVENYLLKLEVLPKKIESLELQKQIAMIALNDCIVKMPFDGIIYDVNIEKNQYILKGKSLLKAYDKNHMEIQIDLSVTQFAKFDKKEDLKNLQAQFYSSSFDKTYGGIFSRISDSIDQKTRTIKFVFDLKETLLKGLFLEANIIIKELKNIIAIPKDSYHGGVVYILKNKSLEFREVDIIDKTDQFYIVDGLKEDESLIISDIIPAIEGMKIRGI